MADSKNYACHRCLAPHFGAIFVKKHLNENNMSRNKENRFHHKDENQGSPVNEPETTPIDLENEEGEVMDDIEAIDEENQTPELEAEVLELNRQLEEEKKKYLLLYADFDNFRKRSLREKAELIKNGGEQAFKGLLPTLDDFERGLDAAHKDEKADPQTVEGFQLIYNKLKKYLEQNGVKEFEDADDTFDADRHEAISAIPAPSEDKKGKILDTVQKGYTINGKVLRHAKVVVGQ